MHLVELIQQSGIFYVGRKPLIEFHVAPAWQLVRPRNERKTNSPAFCRPWALFPFHCSIIRPNHLFALDSRS
ncbi:hypothetical protein M413DRAFT_386456 [Hebeloma cylindrosporum]|uniref:Uncharacterized protein n=1 Tax=Hebeloma cylindrosporum TaxID=76867 RepID=A0A0C2YRN9_HEBCY|nr:hypothetical protein M413DRAFT_386456 [Hebeloma cylindrosporum h7]